MAIKGKIALIIDDDPSVRALACKVVEGIGFEVMEASGVIEALRMIKERVPHLILLDLNMPEVNGFSFLKMAQQNSKLHDIPVVVFSAESRNNTILKAIEMGAQDYLVKPLNAKVMIQKIRRVFHKIKQQPKFTMLASPKKIEMIVDVELMRLSSKDCEIDGPIKLIPGSGLLKVSLDSLDLKEGNRFLCSVTGTHHSNLGKGRYVSSGSFQGMPDKSRKEIAKLTRGWRVE